MAQAPRANPPLRPPECRTRSPLPSAAPGRALPAVPPAPPGLSPGRGPVPSPASPSLRQEGLSSVSAASRVQQVGNFPSEIIRNLSTSFTCALGTSGAEMALFGPAGAGGPGRAGCGRCRPRLPLCLPHGTAGAAPGEQRCGGPIPPPSVGPKGRDTGPRWEMGPGTGRCPHRELGCCGAGTTLAVQKPICTGSARTVGSRWEHPDTKCPRGCGRDQLLLGTGTRHPATPPLVLMAAALVPQSCCPSRGRQPPMSPGPAGGKGGKGLCFLCSLFRADPCAPLAQVELDRMSAPCPVSGWGGLQGMLLSVGTAAEATHLSCPGPLSLWLHPPPPSLPDESSQALLILQLMQLGKCPGQCP